jgi:hypothetical protein
VSDEQSLFRDRDGSILLIRLPGDCWNVCTNQRDADWIRETECSGALAGLTTAGVAFHRVVPLSEVKEALLGEEVLDEAEAAYDSSPVGGRRALTAAFTAALKEAGYGD